MNTAIKPEMIAIPSGPFLMGTRDEDVELLMSQFELARRWREKGFFSREQPQHILTLPDYAIGKHPVTVGEYRIFMEDAGYRQRELWTAPGWDWISATRRMNPDYWETDRWTRIEELPVVGVSRHEAHAFCNWLSKASGLPYRLPTEDEWEKAARGTDGRIYPWGNSFDPTLCNMRQNSLELTTPIGQYSPGGDSQHGCCDMAGNVSEWTASRFESYPFRPDSPGHDRAASVEYVLRGGSWHSHALRVRTTARGMNDPWFTDDDVGFRLALSP